MTTAFFVSDLHGRIDRYEKLFKEIDKDEPEFVFLGGDLLPFGGGIAKDDEPEFDNFIRDYLAPKFAKIRNKYNYRKPHIMIILGNDDPRVFEPVMKDTEYAKIWNYISSEKVSVDGWNFYGYSYIPPTPFMLKDWEKYDVSRYVDPGCSHPYEGTRSVYIMERDLIYSTIKTDIDNMTKNEKEFDKTVFLFHAPPYDTKLDRAALDGKTIDHAPLDVHIGSVAIKKFIEKKQPYISLHGHVHESTNITGHWYQKISNTHSFQGAHNGSELSIIKFDLSNPSKAERFLL